MSAHHTQHYCPYCGTPRDAGVRFCTSCHYDFGTQARPVESTAEDPDDTQTLPKLTPELTEPSAPKVDTSGFGPKRRGRRHRAATRDTPTDFDPSAPPERIFRSIPKTQGGRPQDERKGVDKVVVVCGIICALCVAIIGATMFLRHGTLAGVTSAEQASAVPAAPPTFTSAIASSSLPGDQYTSYYGPLNAIDNDPHTAWTEGVDGFGAGEWLRIIADTPQTVSGAQVLPGYTLSEDIYIRNHRPCLVTISLSDGYTRQFELSDIGGQWQTIDFDGPHQTTYVQLTIESVYLGSTWDDTCVTELSAY